MADSDPRTDAHFQELLDRWADADPEGREAVGQLIRDTFEEDLAIFVLDMSGFSATVAREGILGFLGRVSQMRAIAVPAIERCGGVVVKFIADDVMAACANPDDALAAALEIRSATQVALGVDQADMRFEVCIGIGFGPTLHVPNVDLWGDEVNRAFKLGEDTAKAGGILLTERAFEALRNKPATATALNLVVSGLRLHAHRV